MHHIFSLLEIFKSFCGFLNIAFLQTLKQEVIIYF